jgi:hypothetical protein
MATDLATAVDVAALQRLLDVQACTDLLTRYCRALDWLDDEALGAVFTDDAEIDYGFFTGSGADFAPFVMGVERSFARRWHIGGNAIVSVDGDRAEAESHCQAGAVAVEGTVETTNLFGGRYLDSLVRTADGWRIARRVFVLDWQHSVSIDTAAGEALPGLTWSNGLDHTSPLYRRL